MGRRKATVNPSKSGVTREGTCSECWNIFTIAALYHKRNGKRKCMYEVLEHQCENCLFYLSPETAI